MTLGHSTKISRIDLRRIAELFYIVIFSANIPFFSQNFDNFIKIKKHRNYLQVIKILRDVRWDEIFVCFVELRLRVQLRKETGKKKRNVFSYNQIKTV